MSYFGGYRSSNQSCQEFVIFIMYNLCHPPFFNMSDIKSLVPVALVILPFFLPLFGKWLQDLYEFLVKDFVV